MSRGSLPTENIVSSKGDLFIFRDLLEQNSAIIQTVLKSDWSIYLQIGILDFCRSATCLTAVFLLSLRLGSLNALSASSEWRPISTIILTNWGGQTTTTVDQTVQLWLYCEGGRNFNQAGGWCDIPLSQPNQTATWSRCRICFVPFPTNFDPNWKVTWFDVTA